VADFAEVQVELVGSDTPVDRCIHFIMKDVDSCSMIPDMIVSFTGGPATVMIEVPFAACGTWLDVCAKDEQHTLWSSTSLDADQIGTAVIELDGGDSDNDGDVDIDDVTMFIAQFGTPPPTDSCPWDGARNADFSNNGAVGAEDYPFFTAKWRHQTSCNCAVSAAGIESLSASAVGLAIEVSSLRPEVARRVDLNSDGVFDVTDVEAFEALHGLPNTLSTVMKKDRAQRTQSSTKVQRTPVESGR
jgi:hypothetical protein